MQVEKFVHLCMRYIICVAAAAAAAALSLCLVDTVDAVVQSNSFLP